MQPCPTRYQLHLLLTEQLSARGAAVPMVLAATFHPMGVLPPEAADWPPSLVRELPFQLRLDQPAQQGIGRRIVEGRAKDVGRLFWLVEHQEPMPEQVGERPA